LLPADGEAGRFAEGSSWFGGAIVVVVLMNEAD